MLTRLREWRQRRIIARDGPDPAAWQVMLDQLPLAAGLTASETERLRQLSVLLLHQVQTVAAAGLRLDRDMALLLAAQACLPILNLGLSWYRRCATIVVYPGDFVARHRYHDEFGLEHDEQLPLAGEAWDTGPVVLSWDDVVGSGERDGFNVVIHEFAHKLDMLNGDANGHPPLHADMSLQEWTGTFTEAYEDLCRRVAAGDSGLPMDAYATENPGEFFAVASESFFELPHLLRDQYPVLYDQLAAFYRQSPADRLRPVVFPVAATDQSSSASL